MHIPLHDIRANPLFLRQIERVHVSDVQVAERPKQKKPEVEGRPFMMAKKVSPACHRANHSAIGRNEKIAVLFAGLSGLAAAAVTTSLVALVILGLSGTVYLTYKAFQKAKEQQNKGPYATVRSSYANAVMKTGDLPNPEDKAPGTFPRIGEGLTPKVKAIALLSPEDKAPNLPPRVGDGLTPKQKNQTASFSEPVTPTGKEIEVIGRQIEKLWQSGRMDDLCESVQKFEVPTNHDLSDAEWEYSDDLDQSQTQDMMELY